MQIVQVVVSPWLVHASLSLSVAKHMGFKRAQYGFASMRKGFKRYQLKTNANHMQVMRATLQVHANTRKCLVVLL